MPCICAHCLLHHRACRLAPSPAARQLAPQLASADSAALNATYFDPDAYLKRMLKETRLAELAAKQRDMLAEVGSLDSDMQVGGPVRSGSGEGQLLAAPRVDELLPSPSSHATIAAARLLADEACHKVSSISQSISCDPFLCPSPPVSDAGV